MTPLFISVLLAAMCLECRAQKDNVLQAEGEETAAEGGTVTLGCLYNTSSLSNHYLYWYKQDGNNSPKFILSRFKVGEGKTGAGDRFSSTLDSSIRSVPLKIQKLQLSDSAVYYCALTGGGGYKIMFGKGTRLTIETRTEYKPSYFKVVAGNDTACLATGFSRHNATASNQHPYSKEFSETKAVAISPNLDLYNQVVFPGDGADKCELPGSSPSQCIDVLEPDPKVNVMSLTILALRVIFIKTIIFNIIMTLRLWISQ